MSESNWVYEDECLGGVFEVKNGEPVWDDWGRESLEITVSSYGLLKTREEIQSATEEDLRALVWDYYSINEKDFRLMREILRDEAQEYRVLAEACIRVVLCALLNDDEIVPDIDAVLYNLLVGGGLVCDNSGYSSPMMKESKEVGKRLYEETLSVGAMKKNDYKRLRELLNKVMGDPITRVGLFTPSFDGGTFND